MTPVSEATLTQPSNGANPKLPAGGWGGVVLAVLIGVALTWLFFPTLWQGGGLVGGDIYTYFYPQKQFYAEALKSGELPLWNHRTGHGYPTVGESQTGVFYPFHFLYALLNLNTAYNAIQMAHYVIAFLGCWLLAKRWGLAMLPSCLAAVVYTFGWLPTRICVEWAALGAAWFPWAIWCAESFLQTNRRRYLLLLSGLLALQMLAGHFHLAFITQLTLAAYVPLRMWLSPTVIGPAVLSQRGTALVWCYGAIVCGFGLAAFQLGPTWELKQQSQRAALGDEHDPGFGYIPWWYLGQMVAPWSFYDPTLSLGNTPPGQPRTNTVEAHLYCGLLPLVLIAAGCVAGGRHRDRRTLIWWLLGGAALVYATGSLIPIAKHLPGFGFFNGVGRYGIVVNLAVGLLAAESLQRLLKSLRPVAIIVTGIAAVAVTTGDCWFIAQMIQHTVAVPRPPLRYLGESAIRKELAGATQPIRLFCRGANLPNLLGVSSTPVYLGLGPDAYFDPRYAMPQPLPFDTDPTPEQVDWLRRAGVTHILSFTPLDTSAWPIELLAATPDSFLNRAWARALNEPLFLYELKDAWGRVYWQHHSSVSTANITDYRANSLTIEAHAAVEETLIVADLAWPGWQVSVDGKEVPKADSDPEVAPYRAVRVPIGAHKIVWTYRPASLRWGYVISVTTAALMLAALILAKRKSRGLQR